LFIEKGTYLEPPEHALEYPPEKMPAIKNAHNIVCGRFESNKCFISVTNQTN
jgi:hypothetical protein